MKTKTETEDNLIQDPEEAELLAHVESGARDEAVDAAKRLVELGDTGLNPVKAIRKRVIESEVDTWTERATSDSAKIEKQIERIRTAKESPASQNFMDAVIERASSRDNTQDAATALRAYKEASPVEAIDLWRDEQSELVGLVEEIAIGMAGKEKFKEKFTVSGSSKIIPDWNPLSAALDADDDKVDYATSKGVTSPNPLYMEDVFFVLGLDAFEPASIPPSGAFAGVKSNQQTYFNKHGEQEWQEVEVPRYEGVNLTFNYVSGSTISTAEAKFIPEHVEVILNANPTKS